MLARLPLSQSWLPEPEPGFKPGFVDLSWQQGTLHLRAELADDDVMTIASAHGQRLWELGDVMELFVQRVGENGYREYQIAPNGLTLALYYPDTACVAAVRSGRRYMEEFLIDEIPETDVFKTVGGWSVCLSVPLSASAGERFRISCCRYDAGTGRVPVISSTSPHPVRDFHRPQDWREFVPVAG